MTQINKKISIVIPVYNEINTIATLIKRLEDVDLGLEKEIIIVDNCSTDGTRELLITYQKRHTIIYQERNMGMSNSIRKGLAASTGDFLMKQDGDLEYDPQDIKKLIQPLLNDQADAVYGSRFLTSDNHAAWNYRHLLGNKALTFVSNIVTNMYLTDMETCYKLYTRELYNKVTLKSNKFEFEPEITIQFAKARARIREVSISYSPRSYNEGKKVKWSDGVHAIWTILKIAYFSK
ncbi:MAG: glycosyltransferase family 2 protein [Planctomycetes bacterium]|nr:glycosyltransferase family 2 protein [Planctomycetota bacterium]